MAIEVDAGSGKSEMTSPIIALSCAAAIAGNGPSGLPVGQLADRYFGADSAWFKANVPFFECADEKIQDIYYYRWKLYKAHIRDLGQKGFLITEFLDDVGWQKHPYAMLNDATGFHIYEGRWLRDRSIIDGFVNFLYPGGGNDRHFSESIADATYAFAMAKGDMKWAVQYLPAMRHIYNLWDDHYDFSKQLYFIEPLLDATEYTISSVDASGGKDGFRGGDSFRPTINSYMYANALVISRLAAIAGDKETAAEYAARATALKTRVQEALWNEGLKHFIDRYQVSNSHVKYWDSIRGRELAGYVPWVFNLPADEARFNEAWSHLQDPGEFGGRFGLRTVGPSYQYYLRQYRYLGEQPECQWNGPSWPFQTTQVLLGLANLLNDYRQDAVTAKDYIHLLHQYAEQHFLEGVPNLQEDYNPDTGKPIVGLDRSHHYNHSGFNDLVITGLAGLRPRADDVLEINPLVPSDGSLPYFSITGIPYHGREVTVVWDVDGKRYGVGAGLSVYVDGKRRSGPSPLGRRLIPIGKSKVGQNHSAFNLAVNVYKHGFPSPSASTDSGQSLWQAVDGRSWYFKEMVRGWEPKVEDPTPWYQVDFEKPTTIREIRLSLYEDNEKAFIPGGYSIEIWNGSDWQVAATISGSLPKMIGNTTVGVELTPVTTRKIRVSFRQNRPMRLVELSVY